MAEGRNRGGCKRQRQSGSSSQNGDHVQVNYGCILPPAPASCRCLLPPAAASGLLCVLRGEFRATLKGNPHQSLTRYVAREKA